jgi:hypothetical protein
MNSTSNAGRAGLLCLLLSALTLQILPAAPGSPKALAPAEFARLIREFSEEGGYFRSDNFTSNETSYLHHRTATILQRIPVLLRDYDSGSLKDYRSLVTSNFISGVQP